MFRITPKAIVILFTLSQFGCGSNTGVKVVDTEDTETEDTDTDTDTGENGDDSDIETDETPDTTTGELDSGTRILASFNGFVDSVKISSSGEYVVFRSTAWGSTSDPQNFSWYDEDPGHSIPSKLLIYEISTNKISCIVSCDETRVPHSNPQIGANETLVTYGVGDAIGPNQYSREIYRYNHRTNDVSIIYSATDVRTLPDVSDDGEALAYSNLVQSVPTYVDVNSGTVRLTNIDTDGVEKLFTYRTMNVDGRFVFMHAANQLFRHSVDGATTIRYNPGDPLIGCDANPSIPASLSGEYVMGGCGISSYEPSLINIEDNTYRVLPDQFPGFETRLSVDIKPISLSHDAKYVSLRAGSLFAQNPENSQLVIKTSQIFIYDVDNNSYERLSIDPDNPSALGYFYGGDISADGSRSILTLSDVGDKRVPTKLILWEK